MIPRHQLAVAPQISPTMLARAGRALLMPGGATVNAAVSALRTAFDATACVVTDSGTSALVLALRMLAGRGGTVALPGYGCVDLASAVRYAGVRVRLYDVEPTTLSPDLSSVEWALKRGVDAVLVAHLYGYPADVPSVRALADGYGVPVLEDAAQAAGGSLHGVRLGSLGDLSILSFGRGKGLFGGRGGAVLAFTPEWSERLTALRELPRRGGIRDFAAATAQWVFGRPGLYALPASLPWLHLGEMIYRPAHEPESLSASAGALVRSALDDEPRACTARRRNADVLRAFASEYGEGLEPIQVSTRGEAGFLRFAVLDRSGRRGVSPRLGVMRGYPRTLHEQMELRPQLLAGEPATPGAVELRSSLFTLPTHGWVNEGDLLALKNWLRHQEATMPEPQTAAVRASVALPNTLPMR